MVQAPSPSAERPREVIPLATAEKEIEALLGDAAELRAQVQRRIVGQERVLEEVIIALLAGGGGALGGGGRGRQKPPGGAAPPARGAGVDAAPCPPPPPPRRA